MGSLGSKPASIVLAVDRSESMNEALKLPAAQTSVGTFVYIMREQDRFAVTGFNSTANAVYPAGSKLETIGEAAQEAAVKAIEGLTALGLTNVKAAIDVSHAYFGSVPSPRGIVLLSDGIVTAGGDPLANLPVDVPIYTIALGRDFKPTYLQEIATKTHGKYHFAPVGVQLYAIYNDIVSDTQVARAIANVETTVGPYRFSLTPFEIAAGTSDATVAVDWLPPDVTYVHGPPSGSRLTVNLIDPDGNVLTQEPSAVATGFCVFRIAAPKAGQWQVEIWSSASVRILGNVGVFEPESEAGLELDLEAPTAAVGGRLGYEARLLDGEEPLDRVRASASLERPLGSPVPDPDGDPESALVRRPLPPPAFEDSVLRGMIDDLPCAGSATLRIQATGHRADGTAVTRHRRCSFIVG